MAFVVVVVVDVGAAVAVDGSAVVAVVGKFVVVVGFVVGNVAVAVLFSVVILAGESVEMVLYLT